MMAYSSVDDFDTLVFSHSLDGEGQLFIDLSSGIGMFGNNQVSPIVQFAEIGNATYDLDWERLETEGSSNDFVIVGGGIGSSTDNKALASSTSAIVDGFFEMSLGMGEDQVYVNDTSTGITLDLSGCAAEDGSSQVVLKTWLRQGYIGWKVKAKTL